MKHGASHKKQINSLKRIEGQVAGVLKMVSEERYCVDILTQLKAIRSALASVENQIMDQHIQHCVHSAIESKKASETQRVLGEIRQLLKWKKA